MKQENAGDKTAAQTLQGCRFFALVTAVYLVLALVRPELFSTLITRYGQLLFKVLPFLAMIVVLNALINWKLTAGMMQAFRTSRSTHRWLVALGAGILSHGPLYLWFPLIDDLRQKGLNDGLLSCFFFARAIKLPLLPVMVEYLGLSFTLILSGYILLGALVQGLIMERWQKQG
ncbi:MAG: hypothetical protein JXR59_04780 [Desulfuromonadaceae bacterium]|nr:hypothetical protein [Desulfuromonadaceae bacterium]